MGNIKRLLMISTIASVVMAASPAIGNDSFIAGFRILNQDFTCDVQVGRDFITMRIDGVAFPEKGEPYHDESIEFLRDKLLGFDVQIIPNGKDQFGRLNGRIRLINVAGGDTTYRDISEIAITAGYARYFHEYSMDTILEKLQAEAIKFRKGIWSASRPLDPKGSPLSDSDASKYVAHKAEFIGPNIPTKFKAKMESVSQSDKEMMRLAWLSSQSCTRDRLMGDTTAQFVDDDWVAITNSDMHGSWLVLGTLYSNNMNGVREKGIFLSRVRFLGGDPNLMENWNCLDMSRPSHQELERILKYYDKP